MPDTRRTDGCCCSEMTRSWAVEKYMMAVEIVMTVVELATVVVGFANEVQCMELVVVVV